MVLVSNTILCCAVSEAITVLRTPIIPSDIDNLSLYAIAIRFPAGFACMKIHISPARIPAEE